MPTILNAEEETDAYKAVNQVIRCCFITMVMVHRQRNYNGDEVNGYDETFCPLGSETQGMIVDDEINAAIVRPLPYGVKLHAIIDSCHSGTVLDLHPVAE